MTRARAKKSDKIHPLKVKGVKCQQVYNRRPSEEGFDSEEGRPIIRENYVGEFLHEEWIALLKAPRNGASATDDVCEPRFSVQ